MSGEYYPFRPITLPELRSGSLTHSLTPTMTTEAAGGRIGFWTVLAEAEAAFFDGGPEQLGWAA
ncbi:MAG TPA: hypothetical protein VGN49_11935 [Micrococcaceae bacterium]|jgi:hypothetical protein|nr:hypothetical protein [Micrococcaceae bacterium]